MGKRSCTRENGEPVSAALHFAVEDVIKRNLTMHRIVEVETVHADHPLAPAEGCKPVRGESAVADE